MSKAQRRATKEYYPPHLTGHGSRGLMALALVLFDLGVFLDIFVVKLSGYVQSTSSVPWQIAHFRSGKMIFLHSHFLCESVEIQFIFTLR